VRWRWSEQQQDKMRLWCNNSNNQPETSRRKQQENSPLTPLDEWWEVRLTSSGADLNLVLRMFDPSCGLLSKRNEMKCAVHIRTNLTEAGATAKTEEFQQHLLAIAVELLELDDNLDKDNVGHVKQDA
jgi:hypothetical protein